MVKIAICDDENYYVEKIKNILEPILNKSNIQYKISEYTNSDFFRMELEEEYFDIVFLDVEMPSVNGLELAKKINEINTDIIVILVTSFAQYALEAWNLDTFKYITKSTIDERIPQVFKLALSKIEKLNTEKYYVWEVANQYHKLSYNDILYIYRDAKNAVIALKNGEIRKIRKTLINIYDDFSPDYFAFVERGYIVNLMHVNELRKDKVLLGDDIEIPLGKTYSDDVRLKLSKYWRDIE